MVVKQFHNGGQPPFWKSIYHHISVKSSDFHEILYIAADFELDERHVIKNEKVALDKTHEFDRNVFLVYSYINHILILYTNVLYYTLYYTILQLHDSAWQMIVSIYFSSCLNWNWWADFTHTVNIWSVPEYLSHGTFSSLLARPLGRLPPKWETFKRQTSVPIIGGSI